MAELDKGGVEQDKAFWEDVSVEFNDYSKPDYSKLILSSLSDQKIFSEKQVDPSAKSSKNSSWESLRKMFMNIQKDYKAATIQILFMTFAMAGWTRITYTVG